MIFDSWVQNIADSIGVSLEVTGILLSLLFTVSVLLLGLLATRGKGEFGHFLAGFGCFTLFVILGWLPYWLMLISVLIIAGIYSDKLRKWFGG